MIIFRKSAEEVLPDVPVKEIKNGDIVKLKVIKKIEKAWQVSIGGKFYAAEIQNIKVHPGQLLTARALIEDATLMLKVLEEGRSNRSSQGDFVFSNVSQEIAKKSITDLIQALGFSIEGDRLEQIVSVVQQCNREDQGFIRLLLILLDKGLPLSHDLINAIEKELEGHSGKRERRKERDTQQDKDENGKDDPTRSIEKVVESPLVLVNHLEGFQDNWIFLPLTIKTRNREEEGFLKIQTQSEKDSARKGNQKDILKRRIKRIVFTIHRNRESWGFIIKNFNKEKRTLTIYAEGEKKGKKIGYAIGNLEEFMRKLHIEVDKNIKNWEDFNGFEEKIKKSHLRIDTFA